jgi:hypothetical protein
MTLYNVFRKQGRHDILYRQGLMVVDLYPSICLEARCCTMGPLQIFREGQMFVMLGSPHTMHPLLCDVDFFGAANVPLFTETPSSPRLLRT